MVTVHLLRHGEVHNPDRVLYGRLPGFRLSALGERQAEHAARWLAARGDVVHVVASPLQRAQQTAAPLAAATGLDIATDDRLIEADNALEGRQVAGGKGLLRDPANWKYFRNPFRPSWGEPYDEIAARMLGATHAARDAVLAAGGGSAVCVSHQLPIVMVQRNVEGLRLFHDPRRRRCSLASVTSLTFAEDDAGNWDTVVALDYAEPAADLPAGEGLGA